MSALVEKNLVSVADEEADQEFRIASFDKFLKGKNPVSKSHCEASCSKPVDTTHSGLDVIDDIDDDTSSVTSMDTGYPTSP